MAQPLDIPSRRWQLQTAKAQFNELFRLARAGGPQWVTRNKESVVVISAEVFERLGARARQPQNLVQFFGQSPLAKVKLDLKRKRDLGRRMTL